MLDHERGQAGQPYVDTRPEALAREFGLADPGESFPMARVRVHGHEATLACRIDVHEHLRRAAFVDGRPVLADWGPLNLLMALPYEEPVRVATLTNRERMMLPRLPSWSHTVHDGYIRRTARPPLTPVLATVEASRWAAGLTKALAYVEFCAPVVVFEGDLDDPFAPMEAAEEGVGLVVDSTLLVAPNAKARKRSANTWWLAEHAYWRLPH